MNNQVLKPCPFCSCTDVGEVTINPHLESRHRRFKVYCKVCQCRTSEHKTRKEARIYWNTRATSAPIPDHSEDVRAMVVPDIARFEKHAMKAKDCLSECDVVLLSSIRRLLAASTTPGDSQ